MAGHEVVLMLTRRCNFRCEYCYQTHANLDQDAEVVERVARSLRARPGTTLVFHGGEPLLRKDLIRRGVELLLDEDGEPLARFAVVTNGSLIDDETLEFFARHRFRVDVSFDGVLEAQKHRDEASFDALVGTLRELARCASEGRLTFRVSITVTLMNLPFLARSVAFLTELGVPRIEIDADAFGPWEDGARREVEREVEAVARQMEQRAGRGLPVPVRRFDPVPDLPPATEEARARL